jgi:hypothetical protein
VLDLYGFKHDVVSLMQVLKSHQLLQAQTLLAEILYQESLSLEFKSFGLGVRNLGGVQTDGQEQMQRYEKARLV